MHNHNQHICTRTTRPNAQSSALFHNDKNKW